MSKLFLPQTTLEEWALGEKADLHDGKLTVVGEGGAWPVEPAVHFVKLVSGQDAHGLVTKVKTERQLASLGAEQMADSVVLGEAAYEVVPGYVAALPDEAPAGDPRKGSPESDLLAAFLLDKL
ncbi:MAG: hypothetical protein L0Y66_18970 [Myxococcaceae bacterium]|nr:hypothetical protein [Myxococcaceae bacterium]